MFRFLKRLFILAFIILLAFVFWGVFAIWTGIYSVYSLPASKDYPDGATLIVSRDQGEPMFNSPAYKEPPKKKEPQGGGLSFGPMKKPPRPLKVRTLLELPYIEWAYEQSLKTESPEKPETSTPED
jgi:hypothetical protein